jgi:hypothetical protein
VHVVVVQVFLAKRLEGVQSDAQGDVCDLHTLSAQPVEHLRGEMQSGSGRGSGARFPRVHGLVSLGVAQGLMDVGRQGSHAQVGQDGVETTRRLELDLPPPFPKVAYYDGGDTAAERQEGALVKTAAGPHQAFPNIALAVTFEQKNLAPARWLGSVEIDWDPRGDHARVVDHQQVATPQESWKVIEMHVPNLAVGRQMQKAGVAAARRGPLRDQARREPVVEVAK